MSELFLPDRTSPFEPPALLRKLRGEAPVSKVALWDGREVWFVTRHSEAVQILADPRFLSASPALLSFAANQAVPLTVLGRTDGADHIRLRVPVAHGFSATAAAATRPAIQRIVDARLDEVLAGEPPADLVSALTWQVPLAVLLHVIGLPGQDLGFFLNRTRIVNDYHQPVGRDAAVTEEEAAAAHADIFRFVRGLVIAREQRPADDLVSHLTGALSREEIVDIVCGLLSVGHSGTANMLGLCVVSLLHEPGLFRALRHDPALVPHAVEELLRYHTILQYGLRRHAAQDVEIGGALIRAGDGVVVSISSANRDEAAFADPDALDVHRDAHRHLAFGHGPHACLGQHLARAELEIALGTIVRRVPSMRLAVPLDELAFRDNLHHYGVHALPVTW